MRAHVVYLFVAGTLADIRTANWIAQCQWVDPGLDSQYQPLPLNGDEETSGVSILWNRHYEQQKKWLQENTESKGTLLRQIHELVSESRPLIREAANVLSAMQAGICDREDADRRLRAVSGPMGELGRRGGDLAFAPEDLKELDAAAQSLFSSLTDLSIFYSELAEKRWKKTVRLGLVCETVKILQRELQRVDRELERL